VLSTSTLFASAFEEPDQIATRALMREILIARGCYQHRLCPRLHSRNLTKLPPERLYERSISRLCWKSTTTIQPIPYICDHCPRDLVDECPTVDAECRRVRENDLSTGGWLSWRVLVCPRLVCKKILGVIGVCHVTAAARVFLQPFQ